VIKKKLVEGLRFAGKECETYAILDGNDLPIFIPTQWLLSRATINGSPKTTLRTYASRITSFLNVVEKSVRRDKSKVTLSNVTEEEIQGFLLGYVLGTNQNKISTCKNYHAALVEMYKWANDTGLVEHKDIPLNLSAARQISLTNEKSHLQLLQTTYLTEEEFIDTVLSNVQAEKSFDQERDELVLWLGYYAGFRTHENGNKKNLRVEDLRKLLPKDIKAISAQHLIVYGKGNNKAREIPFTPKLLEKIHKFLWGAANHIKTGPLICTMGGKTLAEEHGTRVFNAAKKRYLSSASLDKDGLAAWENRAYHLLRKCYATNAVAELIAEGKSPWVWVPQWMGHEDPEITRDYVFFDAVLNGRLEVIESLTLTEQKSRHHE
jgi:integrase